MHTQKLLENLDNVDLYHVNDINQVDFIEYEYVGFASGIYHGQLSNKIMELAKEFKLNDKARVSIIYTCGLKIKNYAKSLEKTL
ncbi:hypothetical protein [Facklamia sp. 7083-14-GEN3]|uniref:hypothetical protein n=1 Tax=Facklamia sp. 7083-14-GEN3 TaxID=2973478 RepID=UPI00215CD120|nr:hypothetical protein [Facklamia sp. 7083-14-GEN3]MCR8968748.1 hypothetical protein [Facklamia sp. 7083-14-GEN3]